MTGLTTQPQLLTAAAADASEIRSAIGAANAAAAGPTTTLVAAAEDEVSAIAARFFGAYGQEYQALLHQAAAFHDQFVAALAAAGNAYAQAEAEIASTLGVTGVTGASASPFAAVTQAADPTGQCHFDYVGHRRCNTATGIHAGCLQRVLDEFQHWQWPSPEPHPHGRVHG